ncbi:phosphate acetyltransferase [Mucilaginibacter sp. BT774]|uniref:phosphate acetyltransferase n=1 Tax=Mucilaginibacter sp. BT774 TaxID=3062276 RepID=UPI0026760F6F|nr:phosphate acetyltransferase [Mucilaginibacter sp. BT774]MDO3628217.1 phosphate acetyltransferase [Mucilaginibacter sp. BT774]
MAKSVYVLSTEADSGKFVISLGLMNMFGQSFKTAYFKPVIGQMKSGEEDPDIKTISNYFSTGAEMKNCFAISGDYCTLEATNRGEMIDTIIEKYKLLEKNHDWIIVQGTDYFNTASAFETNLNIEIAENISTPILLVIKGDNKTESEILAEADEMYCQLSSRSILMAGIAVNKVAPSLTKMLLYKLQNKFSSKFPVSVIPCIKELSNPVMAEICRAVDGVLLSGKENLLNTVSQTIVGTASVKRTFSQIDEPALIITSADRIDIIKTAANAYHSGNNNSIAGVVLSSKAKPNEQLLRLIAETDLPVIFSYNAVFDIVLSISHIRSHISFEKREKIRQAINAFEKWVAKSGLEKRLKEKFPYIITPHMFQFQLMELARKSKARIVMPEGDDPRILKAAARVISLKLGEIILMGHPDQIKSLIKQDQIGLDLTQVEIVDPINDLDFELYSDRLYELRKKSGLSRNTADALMADASYFGTMMVYSGRADAMVSGAVYTTRQTVKPALEFIKMKEGKQLVSSIFFMCLPHRVVIFGDCAINPNPSVEQLAEIAISSAETAQIFNIEPRIAMISYSSGQSGVGDEVEKVRLATEIVKSRRPDLDVEGPIQYDAAVNPLTAKTKLPGSKVAGKANVFIFPDLNTGNSIYKAVQQETGAMAIGPILQNLNKPVNDLSRGATVDDIFNTILVTLIQCGREDSRITKTFHSRKTAAILGR